MAKSFKLPVSKYLAALEQANAKTKLELTAARFKDAADFVLPQWSKYRLLPRLRLSPQVKRPDYYRGGEQ